ncbi:hypothetical protein LCGC14_2150020 [marine sediment metagenome]|uniref:Uncharacterized protein n=1 Tax=marine sediment metagenome TaxID=412755 RepID=A0A0F9GS61_9ZZZZ
MKTEQEWCEFLKDLGDICRKHKVDIGGCGCCGSPFVFCGDSKAEPIIKRGEPIYSAQMKADSLEELEYASADLEGRICERKEQA